MLHKKPLGGKKVQVTFSMPALPDVETLYVCSEFNAWSPTGTPMLRGADGSWSVVLALDEGKSYRYRYRDERGNWHNDWHADWYIPNEFGTEDSVLDLSTGATMPQRSHKIAPQKKAPSQPRPQGGGQHPRGGQGKGTPPASRKPGGGPSRGRRSPGRGRRKNRP
jgi:1,4-alpha-glucan branching enzyme